MRWDEDVPNYNATDAGWIDGNLDGDGKVAFSDFLILSDLMRA